MRTIEVSATTVETAIEKGLQMLGVEKKDVEVKIINKESMLKKAKIEMTVFENDEERKEFLESLKNTENKSSKNPEKPTVKKEIVVKEERDLNEEEKIVADICISFLKNVVDSMKIEATIKAIVINNDLYILVNGQSVGNLIGFHGDTLNALQVLMNNIVRNNCDIYKKVFLDIENYRNKRKESLEALALSMSQKVLKNKRSLKLESMNSFERKIIHTVLQGMENIDTHSEGSEPNRYLVIDYIK